MRKRRERKPRNEHFEGLLMSMDEAVLTVALLLKRKADFRVRCKGTQAHVICVSYNGQDRLEQAFDDSCAALQNEMQGFTLNGLTR